MHVYASGSVEHGRGQFVYTIATFTLAAASLVSGILCYSVFQCPHVTCEI